MKNWRCFSVLAAALPLALGMSAAVHAQSADGYLNDDIALRAGPAPEYPEIEGLPYGTYVSVQGCTEGWEWCDVIAEQGDRGWVPGDYIDYVYEDQPVLVTEYGPRIGIPIITFSITNYWNAHYHDRPFYRERATWFHRDIRPHAPPPHHATHRQAPPPPPGGWHHGGRSAGTTRHAGGAPPRHENAPTPPHHEKAPNPPRVPVNRPEHPRGDHHANIPTPPTGAPPHPAPPHAGNMPRPPQPPHEGRMPPPPHSVSGSDHGKHPPQHPRKKDRHDNDDDNGH
jgi:uncharacterized protein YraI